MWRPFDLFIYSHEAGDFLLPTELDLESIDETKRKIALDLSREKDQETIKVFKQAIEDLDYKKADILRVSKKLETDPKTKKKVVEIRKPSYGEYLDGCSEATDWVTGEQRVNDSRLSLILMNGRVKIDGVVLDTQGIKNLDPDEGSYLWRRMKTIMFVNPDRLPFLNSLSEE